MNLTKSHSYRDFILVLLLVFVSGVPAIRSWLGQYVFIYAFVAIIPFIKYKYFVGKTNQFILWIVFSAVVFIAHYFTLSAVSLLADLNYLLRIIVAFCVVAIVGDKFIKTYVKVIYVICILSLVFWLFMNIIGIKIGFNVDDFYKSVLVYNTTEGSFRNSGPFWEPGAFQGYINLALLFLVADLNNTLKYAKNYFFVFVVTILTTQSTTGFLVTGIIAIYVLLKMRTGATSKILWTTILIGGIIYMFQLDFMGDKLTEQYEAFTYTSYSDLRIDHGRFTSMIINWHYIEKHPLFGNGLLLETRYADDIGLMEVVGFGNGFTDFIANMGILYALLYFISIFKRATSIKVYQCFFVGVVILLLQGECFMNYPLFFTLVFLEGSMFYRNYYKGSLEPSLKRKTVSLNRQGELLSC